MVGDRDLFAQQRRASRFQAGALVALIPLVSAGLGAFQLYRDDEKREFDAITFYLQNQRLFDPCSDPAVTNLNLRMINDRYPRVYARIVEHVEDRSAQCDALPAVAPPPPLTPVALAPPETKAASEGALPRTAPLSPTEVAAVEPYASPPAAEPTMDTSAYFRSRYGRLANLPATRNRRVTEGRYRILIEIGDEQDRALAGTLATGLRGLGHSTPGIERTPIHVEGTQLRYYLESQKQDAERLAAELERMAAQGGAVLDVTPTYIGREYPGLPPGVMELWLQ